jgi:hypothetical protein
METEGRLKISKTVAAEFGTIQAKSKKMGVGCQVPGVGGKKINLSFFYRPLAPDTRPLSFAFSLLPYRISSPEMSRSKNFAVYENLDTSFVNLGALLRYLQQRDFSGRVHVDLGDYRAEVTLRAGERPSCKELDVTTGREGEGEGALQRLLVRSMEAGGRINVYGEEAQDERDEFEEPEAPHAEAKSYEAAGRELSDEEIEWQELLRTGADLIACVERAAHSTGANFDAMFRAARLELADDFPFLDPNSMSFEYANNEVELRASPNPRVFVSGICETLRRVVERLATGGRAASLRERVALELAVVARRRSRQLTAFGIMPQLNRIAGTRVI